MPQAVVILAALLAGGILALLAERAFHASGRSGLHLRSLRSNSRLTRAPDQPSPEEFEAIRRAYTLLLSIERSALSRVVGVGATQTSDGITVEFISVELRESGGRGFLRVHSREGFRVQPNPLEQPSEPEPPSVQDDLGTDYVVSWSARSGSGDGDYREATAEFLFAPIPPEGAGRLRVSIPRSDSFGDRRDPQKEPWVFDIAL